jgi:hypothetical protein
MRQVLTLVLIFGAVAVVIALYFSRDESLSASVVAGLLCGATVLIAWLRFSHDPERTKERVLYGFPYSQVAVGALGLFLLVIAAVTGSGALALSGLTFLGVAALLLGAKVALRRGQR